MDKKAHKRVRFAKEKPQEKNINTYKSQQKSSITIEMINKWNKIMEEVEKNATYKS